MRYEPIIEAIERLTDAEETARNIEETMAANLNVLARLLIPRIRKLHGMRAMELKAALRDLDGRTGKWKRRV